MPTDPYGWTIFCDDIRAEIGGKFSFMGVYRGVMFVHDDFPVTMPKFALGIHYRIAADDSRLEDVNVDIFLPGDDEVSPSVKTLFPVSKLIAEAEGRPPTPEATFTFREIGTNLILAPLTFKEEGRIRVQATGGAGVVKLGSLRIERFSEQAPEPKA